MQNKMKYFLVVLMGFVVQTSVCAADTKFENIVDVIEEVNNPDVIAENEALSAAAIEDYQIEGSLFQQITDLEQEKVLMQLEKERAQLNLDLDRLAAEKIKLQMEIDTLSGRAEQQQQEFETERMRLEAEAKRLEREKEILQNPPTTGALIEQATQAVAQSAVPEPAQAQDSDLAKKYKLVNVFGAGAQLQATLQDLSTGQNKRVTVGRSLDGYTVKSISVDDGVVFVKGDDVQTLNVGNN
jgi:type IV pilus biogenesis protein PilP